MAEVLDLPVTTMQIRLVRARQMIRDHVAGNDEHEVQENERCG
jgi:DNA-directed RNA polymerase specialized sigma24 family protein